jgi:hypothetical protein
MLSKHIDKILRRQKEFQPLQVGLEPTASRLLLNAG